MRLRCFSLQTFDEPLTERHLQAVWYDRQMRPPILVSKGGAEVRVVDPGEWNLESGPDFLGATLEIGRERRRMKGDVEIHLRPADWNSHKHFQDAAYSNVIAHVTWADGAVPPNLPQGAISIALGRQMTEDVGFSPAQIDLTLYPFARLPLGERPCCQRLKNDLDLARYVLSQAGKSRLEFKAKKFAREVAELGGDRLQVFYEWFFEALGYKRNSKNFRFIARTVPLAGVVDESANALKAYLKAAEFVEWDMRSCRPNNRPVKRLESAAMFFAKSGFRAYAEIRDFSSKAQRRLVKRLAAAANIGQTRAAAILINVIIPMAIAEGRLDEAPDWLPSEDLSSPMRLTAFRLLGRDHNPRAFYMANGLLMQGLVEIHRKYCLGLYPDCVDCKIAAV